MKVNLKTQPMAPTEAIKAAVNKYVMLLDNPRVTTADVYMKTEKDGQVAEIVLHGRHLELFAKATTENMYRSLKQAVRKVKSQLRRKLNH